MTKLKKSRALGSAAVLAGGSASALLLALTAAPGGASTVLTVDSLADGAAVAADCTTPVVDSCSLRDALSAAVSGDVITFKSGLTGTITLTEGFLTIEAALTLTGAGSTSITVDGNGSEHVFYVYSDFNGDVVMSGLTITGSEGGAAIYAQNVGDFTLTDVNVTGNNGVYGGGLYISNVGAFNLSNSNVSNNTSDYAAGGVYIYRDPTSATITDTTIANNTAGLGGGAICDYHPGNLTIVGSTFSGNHAAGLGGALYLETDDQVITISDSTFNGNTSTDEGGALDFDGVAQVVTINNTTISGNSSDAVGGGIWKDEGGSLTINQSTIVENTATDGAGIFVTDGDPVSIVLSGSIVSNNSLTLEPLSLPSAVKGADISIDWEGGDVLSFDHSLVGLVNDAAESHITDLGGNIRSSTPGLSPLADNGGRTKTMALLATSAAVNAGPSPVATFVGNQFDQRGTGYARVVGTRADIGVFEIQPPPAPNPEPVTPKFTG